MKGMPDTRATLAHVTAAIRDATRNLGVKLEVDRRDGRSILRIIVPANAVQGVTEGLHQTRS